MLREERPHGRFQGTSCQPRSAYVQRQIKVVLVITSTKTSNTIQIVKQSGSSAVFLVRYEVSEKQIKVCDLPRMQ